MLYNIRYAAYTYINYQLRLAPLGQAYLRPSFPAYGDAAFQLAAFQLVRGQIIVAAATMRRSLSSAWR